MKILITGATGFIGQNVAKRLVHDEHEVICVIRDINKRRLLPDKCQIIVKDLSEVEKIDFPAGIDIVIHMAAQLGHYTITEDVYKNVNYEATRKLIELADKSHVKQFIFCSAGFVVGYGKNMTEDMPYSTSKGYAETKAMAERAVIEHRSEGIKWTIVRPGYIYGPGDERRVALYKSIRKGSFILTTSGNAEFSPTYIDDFVDELLLTIDNSKAYGEIFNLCGKNASIQEYFDTIARILDVKLKKLCIGYFPTKAIATVLDSISMRLRNKPGIITPSRADFIGRDHSLSNKKICKEFDYVPKVTLDEGIRRSIDWAVAQNLM